MLIKVKESFEAGMEKVRWLAWLLGERLRVELAVIRLLWKSSDLEKRKSELLRQIGKRVFELRGSGEISVREDRKISGPLKELDALEAELRELKKRASQIGEPEEGPG